MCKVKGMQVLFYVWRGGSKYYPGIRMYGLMKTMEPQGTKCTGRATLHLGGGSCGTYKGDQKMHTGSWWEKLKERSHLEYGGVNEGIILKYTLKK